MKLLSKLAPVKCFVTSTLMMQSAQILQPEPLTPYMGAEFQPLQSIVCVGILIFFGLVQLKIRAADSLSDEIRVLEANKKKASISLLSGLGTPTDLEEIDRKISLLRTERESARTFVKINDDIIFRFRLPGDSTGGDIPDANILKPTQLQGITITQTANTVIGVAVVVLLLFVLNLLSVDPMMSTVTSGSTPF